MVQRNVLVVHNTNEAGFFINPTYTGDAEKYITEFLPTISPENAKRGAALYKDIGSVMEQLQKIHAECKG